MVRKEFAHGVSKLNAENTNEKNNSNKRILPVWKGDYSKRSCSCSISRIVKKLYHSLNNKIVNFIQENGEKISNLHTIKSNRFWSYSSEFLSFLSGKTHLINNKISSTSGAVISLQITLPGDKKILNIFLLWLKFLPMIDCLQLCNKYACDMLQYTTILY